MSPVISAADLGVPETFNAATYFVDRHVQEGRGGKVAMECGDEQITYAALHERVNRFGSALRERLQVRPEERVLLLLLDGPAFAYAFFGTMKAGAIAVPVNTLLKPADYDYLLRDTRAAVLVVSEALLPSVAHVTPRTQPRLRHIVLDGRAQSAGHVRLDELLAHGSSAFEAEPTSRDDAAFWNYSSGSTGLSKGCVHLHHDMVVCAELVGKRTFGITGDDRCFSVAKLFFAYGLGNALYFPLAVGGTSILWPGPPAAKHVYDVIERYRPTVFYSVPTSYGMLLAHRRESSSHDGEGQTTKDFDLSSIRLAVSAGEALPPALFERFKERFGLEVLDGIGSTEALHMFIANRPDAVRVGSSGRIVEGYEARILDQDGRPLPSGEVGNLWISGDSVCREYWNKHQKTIDTIEGRWLRTGDKYSQDADGYFWYAGRADDMLKVGGQWVSPVEVENALIAHPDVLECGVVGHEDNDRLIKPLAFVVLKPEVQGGPERAALLQQFVREQVAEFKRPRWVRFVPELPKTATGKIQRFRLRELAARPAEDPG
ncbi:MAG: benzoate-CoA ligase family protein [Acidobacteriota bacterium]